MSFVVNIPASPLPFLRNAQRWSLKAITSHLPSSNFTLTAVIIATVWWFVLPLFIRSNITDAKGHAIPSGPLLRYAFLRKYPERVLFKWAKQFGPLYTVFMGNQLFVVISDPTIAKDLLVNNGAIFSGRKSYFIKSKVVLNSRAITGTNYGDKWRQHRRIAMQLLTPKAINGYAEVLEYEANILVRSLLQESGYGKLPINPAHYAGRYALNNMLTISFGTRTDTSTDPLVQRAIAMAMEFMELSGPWSNAIDFIKPLQWLPTKIRSRAWKLHDDLIEVYGAMILRVKARMDSGEPVPDCLAKTLIETQEQEKLDWEDLCMLAAVFTLGGVHSTSGLIQWFLALIPSHPEIQARAHEELDRVVGRDRYPTAEDEQNLPYIRAIIKEVQRCHAPFWMGTPHYSTDDFVYNGQFIPKDTVMVLNLYTMHHDEQRYPDPWKFNPDRYLGDNLSCAESAKLPDATERDHFSFGAGRRICPGVHVAERELFLAMASLLWNFNMHEIPGHPISLEEYEGRNGRSPLPFNMRLIPRHDNVISLGEQLKEITLEF
ncbi:cytochrome P450 [Cristinia sonorae]|uniref:Cytochrome P450 n=1 Tax=Cristinia sonorae TaxID=1940300 RepID=A0A8K0UQV8_9AGAR|nr:cytochrome P450 [Cristinia sonorae]